MSVFRAKAENLLALRFSVFDPACVKTCPSRECAELFSLFSSFDGDRQSGSFVIERNRAQRRPVPRRTREAQWARTFTQDHQLGPRAAARWARAFARSIGRRLRLGRFPVGPRASRPPLTL